jgi:hypothetical protein
MVNMLAPPLFEGKGAPTRDHLTEERSLLSQLNVERRKGACLLVMKEGFSFVTEEVSNDISFFVFSEGFSEGEPASARQRCGKERRWSLLQTLIYLSPPGGRKGSHNFICFPFQWKGKRRKSHEKAFPMFGKGFQPRNGMIGGGNFDIASPLLNSSKRSSI